MNKRSIRHMLKPTVVVALVVVMLTGLANSLTGVRAATAASYNVIVGNDTPYGLEPLAFYPQTIKVHKGDTVNWNFRGFHNVRFDTKPLDQVAVNDIDGKKLPELNPVIIAPNLKSGGDAKPGANTGVLFAYNPTAPTFSMVMNLAPGTYTYICDVHPGMVGTIIVEDDSTTIPAPADVDKEGEAAAAQAIADGNSAIADATTSMLPVAKDGVLAVAAGLQKGSTAVSKFFPDQATITVGQSVTWTVPKGFNVHTVNFPLASTGRVDAFSLLIDSKKIPHNVASQAGAPIGKSGDVLPDNGVIQSGILTPGASFTVKFTKPGVYAYYCAIHPDQFGIVEVIPAQ